MKPNYWNKGKLYLSNNDKILKNIIQNYPKEYLSINNNYYHCLINSIIGQQISVSAANSIKNRFFSLNSKINPKNVLKIRNNSLIKVGLSKQKINYIKNISNFFINNKNFINQIQTYDENEIKNKLIQIKGIGPWTVDMFLIFGLGKSNVFPRGDLGFVKAISISYNKKLPISENFLKKLYNKWSPYNTIATWYLWRSLDPLPVSY
ncbi:MAG: DNA-3-methyladenine glycosylase [Alphaproteobacteria bacterium MarineAlpha5_Bin6]|nr:MAG: DNA-3-methyladenine glycosylase [Alphaproteobacteria bacterium MarineAlpha5_Bin7]PPR54083.1 MAG: DNA-3-methyladenine glycosylase [Alphaproteobacteria bacterium MarineAlpha5_Bin6]|tara:strand:- start:619 stop:1236 length:618 start_codon:yes stop_codon:yes gene_type:complete